eukprot:15456157-Alexandrium_andersonii.AAC.1
MALPKPNKRKLNSTGVYEKYEDSKGREVVKGGPRLKETQARVRAIHNSTHFLAVGVSCVVVACQAYPLSFARKLIRLWMDESSDEMVGEAVS